MTVKGLLIHVETLASPVEKRGTLHEDVEFPLYKEVASEESVLKTIVNVRQILSGLGPLNFHARRIATQNCETRRAAEHSSLCSGSCRPLHTPPLNTHQASEGTSQALMEVGEMTARNVADKLIDAWVTGKFGGDFYKAIRKAAKITGTR